MNADDIIEDFKNTRKMKASLRGASIISLMEKHTKISPEDFLESIPYIAASVLKGKPKKTLENFNKYFSKTLMEVVDDMNKTNREE